MATARRVRLSAPDPAGADLAAVATATARSHRLRLTGAGALGVGAAVAVAGAALNTANNLLYLLLALLVAAYLLSAWLARASLARVRGELIAPREAASGAGLGAVARLSVARGRRGAAGLVAELVVEGGGRAVAAVPWLRAGETATLALDPDVAGRGPRDVRLRLRSPWPWGLLEAARVEATASVLVLPAPRHPGALPPELASRAEGRPLTVRGDGAEILDIRDHRPGDDARRIDWKATARLGRVLVREHSRDEERRVVVAIDPALPPGDATKAAAAVEDAIARAAGAIELLAATGFALRLVAPGVDLEAEPRTLVRELALLKPRPASEGAPAWRPPVEGRDPLVVFRAVLS